VNDQPVTYFEDLPAALLLGETITIDRAGEKKTITVPVNFIEQIVEQGKRTSLVLPRIPAIVGEVADSLYAKKAGLLEKDIIRSIDDQPVRYFDEVKPLLAGRAGDTIRLGVDRDGKLVTLTTVLSADASIGFRPALPSMDELEKAGVYSFETKTYGFFASFPAGVSKAIDKLNFYVQQFKKILNPSTGAYKGIGGFKSMGSIFPKTEWNWEVFWNITAFFSIVLAFMNLLPIPALDGGHVVFTIYEMITGRKPSDKFLEYAQMVGMVILLGLILYANGNDWFGWGKGK
jgi:regulator of sigma E protease